MSINVPNFYNGFNPKLQAIDVSAVKEVTSQILDAKQAKSVDLDTLNLSKFRRTDLGLDLYSMRTNAQTATQAAIRHAGVDVNLNQSFIANVQYLNSQAAQASHKVSKQVEGKIVLPLHEDSEISSREIFALPKSTKLFETQNLSKDKRGSNPFSYHKPAQQQEEQQEESISSLSIFA